MPDEPRVARLHLLDDGEERPAPVARFGEAPPPAAGTTAGHDVADLGPVDPEPAGRGVADLGQIEPEPEGSPAPVARIGPARPGRPIREQARPADAPGRGERGSRPRTRRPYPVPAERPAAAAPAAGDDAGGHAERPAAPSGRRWGPKQIDPDADPVAAAKEICLALLTDRARTKHELALALRRRGVPDEAAATALERFDEVGLIDDAAFAGQWVRSRQRSRGLARRALAVELRRKGVDDDTAGDALADVDEAAEEQRARELVARKLRTVPAATPEQRVTAARRLVGMLARKGYPGGLAYRVVREALAAHGAEIDELGEEPSAD